MTKARDIASAAPAPAGVTSTELGYVDGVTSALQTQIDSKIGSAAAINPTIVDAKGDIIAATGADAVSRLAVGANNTVLTADSAEATGLKWAAASSGALVRITTQTFTSTNAINIDNVFSSTYDNYLMLFNITSATATALEMKFRTSGSTNSTANYGNTWRYTQYGAGGTSGTLGMVAGSTFIYVQDITSSQGSVAMELFNPFASFNTMITYLGNQGNGYGVVGAGQFAASTSFDGINFVIAGSGSSATGSVSIYGYTKA